MKSVELPFLSVEHNRHGDQVVFVRRGGRRIRIREKPGTPAFLGCLQRGSGKAIARTAASA
jgi:hypothetical protein